MNEGGLLEVGPESAGAYPGPVSYGRGGSQPTVTDANVLLGRINAEAIIGTGVADPERVRARMEESIGRPLALDAEHAAAAVLISLRTTVIGRRPAISTTIAGSANERSMGDMRAQLGALSIGERRLTAFLDKYAEHTVSAVISEMRRPAYGSKGDGFELGAGDWVQVRTPGGGGYGDPRERPRERVRRDLKSGYFDEASAESDYGYLP